MRLEQLVYVSTATDPARAVMDVSDILEQSVRNNPANNITGALAFTPTRFVQILEGSVSSLDVLLLKLMIDTRHSDLVIVDRIPIQTRSFDAWCMLAPAFTPSGRDRLDVLVAKRHAADRPFPTAVARDDRRTGGRRGGQVSGCAGNLTP